MRKSAIGYALVISAACIGVAIAQGVIPQPATPSPTADITNILNTTLSYIEISILSAVALWTRSHLNDASARKAVLDAAENAMNFAKRRIGVGDGEKVTVPVASALGRLAIGYMNDHVAEHMKQLGMTDERVAHLVISKLPDVGGEGVDQATLNNIVAASNGKEPDPVDYSKLIAILLPAIRQAVSDHVKQKGSVAGAPQSVGVV